MIKVSRPRAKRHKISHKDSFELCYLRHKYVRKAKYNPEPEEMKPFRNISYYMARKTFLRYRNLFLSIGFELEDLVSIANVHLVSFLGSFSLERMPDKYKEFVKVFSDIQERNPEKRDILDKNQANFTLFLKQRMEDVVRVCRQKVRNVKGMPSDEFQYYYGPNPPPKNLNLLTKDHERYGFRKLDSAVFKTIKKRAGLVHTTMFDFAGCYYVAVPLGRTFLSIKDLSGADLDPHDSAHNMSPEDIYLKTEERNVWEQKQKDFNDKPDDVKINIVKSFIRANRRKGRFSEEIRTARKLLRELE